MIIHPSGMIGPEDYSGGYMTEAIKAFLKGYLPFAVEGGYDFVGNGNFSHEKADRELGYSARLIEETLADVVSWIQMEKGMLSSKLFDSRVPAEKVTAREKILGYFMGPIAVMVMNSILSNYLNVYYTDVLKIAMLLGMAFSTAGVLL